MVYLDLDELPSLVGRDAPIGTKKYASRSLLRRDHLFEPTLPLTEEVRQLVRAQVGSSPNGPIRVLTQLRYFGFYFSPLNLFYVYDQRGERVETIVAEVSNTPWNQRHCYVLGEGNATCDAGNLSYSHPKEFHVSPFMGMQIEHRWQLTEPNSKQIFFARMELQRRELSRRQFRRLTLRYPFMTAQITAAIYYQAFRLWWKKCPFYTHPNKQNR